MSINIEPAGPLQHDLLGRGELQFLAGWQHVVEGDVGMEGELIGQANISAHLLDQPIGLRRNAGAFVFVAGAGSAGAAGRFCAAAVAASSTPAANAPRRGRRVKQFIAPPLLRYY